MNQKVLHSLKRGSLFYIKTIKSKPAPSLISIYRNYIKSSIKIFKYFNPAIGKYFFYLLAYKKTVLDKQYNQFNQINSLIRQFQNQSQISNQNNKQTNISNSNKNENIVDQKEQIIKQAHLIKLKSSKGTKQRFFTQKLLQWFQTMHYLTQSMNQSLNFNQQMDQRTKHQQKLIYLSFNASQYFSSNLQVRSKYQSLLLLDILQEDMQYQVLSQKDKQFVRNVIIAVTGSTKKNHSRYITINDYLKDPNSVLTEQMKQKIIISTKQEIKQQNLQSIKGNNNKSRQFNEQNNEIQNQKQDQDIEDNLAQVKQQWKILSMNQRNKAVRTILSQVNKSINQNPQYNKYKLDRNNIPKSLIFQILLNLNYQQKLYQPIPKLQNQIYRIVKKIFTVSDKTQESTLNQSDVNSQHNKQKDNRKSLNSNKQLITLQDLILQNDFLDQFVNQKRIVIV